MAKKLSKREEGMLDKIEELTTDLQRNQAEFENFRRRSEEEKSRSVSFGKRSAISELLPVLDNLERAMSLTPQDMESNDYIQGVKATLKQLGDVLTKLGLVRIESVGQEFNPDTMSAVQMEDGEGDTEVVLEELQAGYMLNDEVIRHAAVKVGHK